MAPSGCQLTTPPGGICNRYRYEQCAKKADSIPSMCIKYGIKIGCADQNYCAVKPEDRRMYMKYCQMSSGTKEKFLPVPVLVLGFLAIKYITDM